MAVLGQCPQVILHRVAIGASGAGGFQNDAGSARAQWRQVADQIRPKVPKLAVVLDEAEEDMLVCMTFPKSHWARLHNTNPIEGLNGEIKRRAEIVGVFSGEATIIRLIRAILLEQNDERAIQRVRYMTLETIAPLGDDPHIMLPVVAA